VAVAFGPDGLLYALELPDMAGFPALGNGKVVRIKSSGKVEDVITGLNVPGGMTWGPDGQLSTSDYSAVPAPTYGRGRILRFDVAFGYCNAGIIESRTSRGQYAIYRLHSNSTALFRTAPL